MAPDKRGSRRKGEINAVTQETLASICGEQCSFVFSGILLRSTEWASSAPLGDNAQFCFTRAWVAPYVPPPHLLLCPRQTQSLYLLLRPSQPSFLPPFPAFGGP